MNSHKQRGGAHIGWAGASWPFASIDIEAGKATIQAIGRYEFPPSDVTAVEKVGFIPFFGKGLRVHHAKGQYPERVIFYPATGRDRLVDVLVQAGFTVGQPRAAARRGSPMRLPGLVAIALLWNLLLYMDRRGPGASAALPGVYTLSAIAGLFALATLLPRSRRLQQLFLRNERHVGEIGSVLRLVQLVAAIQLLIFGVARLAS